MSSCDDNRELIQGNGWKQGAVFALDPDMVKDYIRTHTLDKFPLKGKYKAHLLVISQDCDVLNTGIDEPFVECLVLRKQPKPYGPNMSGHNPRKLHIELGEHFWELQAKEIIYLEKSLLLEHTCPKTEFLDVTEDDLKVIKQWKANRYVRSGLPESFVQITSSVFDELEGSQFLVEHAREIQSIRVFCAEVSDSQFECSFLLLYDQVFCDNNGTDIALLEEKFNEELLAKISEIEGVSLLNLEDGENIFNRLELNDVMSEMEFPLGLTGLFPRYYFDPISFEHNKENEVPSED
ncbi:hypothetical protein [Vibrio diabolicus]|uniref:hypothetical protein n=1 Tax=Vibrio diabolicus TaxID=50719 RepID=UPI00215EC746|nr:hypothetical protein [Vibrio diabolicus]MCS0445072.1 hypothetical protein [Vibrio diabolicus]